MIRLGVVGFGRRMRSMLATIARVDADARVVALVDPRAEALALEFPGELAGARAYADAERMLDVGGLDGVLVGTRCTLHTPYAVAVLARNLPLFLEKPIATSWEQLAELEAAAERTHSPVVVSFPLRVSALCETVRRIVDSGAIGRIEQVQAVNNVPSYAGGYYHGWMRDEEQTGGLWLQKATHDFDYLMNLIGQRPTRIAAMESKTVFRGDMPAGLRCAECGIREECSEGQQSKDDWLCSFAVDTGNHDSASALIQFESGIHCVYTQNFYTRHGAAARGAKLIGYHGTIEFDWYRDELVVHYHHRNEVERHSFAVDGEGHHGGDEELARDFIGVIRGKRTSRAPLEAGLLSVRTCLAARESCRTGTFSELKAPEVARA